MIGEYCAKLMHARLLAARCRPQGHSQYIHAPNAYLGAASGPLYLPHQPGVQLPMLQPSPVSFLDQHGVPVHHNTSPRELEAERYGALHAFTASPPALSTSRQSSMSSSMPRPLPPPPVQPPVQQAGGAQPLSFQPLAPSSRNHSSTEWSPSPSSIERQAKAWPAQQQQQQQQLSPVGPPAGQPPTFLLLSNKLEAAGASSAPTAEAFANTLKPGVRSLELAWRVQQQWAAPATPTHPHCREHIQPSS